MACQSDLGNQITTGGGFSYFFDQPSFQKPHTAMFFAHAAAAGNTPYAGYNGLGRGFPDISLAGAKYLVRIGGEYSSVSGTSASAPAVGGFISNINAARMAAGKGSVGWINPTLYANHSAFVNDIVSGDNHCAADGLCCPHGYETTPGWDPVTGLGTVDYGKMQSLFVSLGSSVNGAQYIPSAAPTYGAKPIVAVPSFRPSSKTPVSNAPYNPPTPRPSTNPPTATPTVAYFTSLQASQVSCISASRRTYHAVRYAVPHDAIPNRTIHTIVYHGILYYSIVYHTATILKLPFASILPYTVEFRSPCIV